MIKAKMVKVTKKIGKTTKKQGNCKPDRHANSSLIIKFFQRENREKKKQMKTKNATGWA
jgi:hypothetical protein